MHKPAIRQAKIADLESILDLFQQTIETINVQDYSHEQIKVWSSGASKKDRWLKKIEEQYFLVAAINFDIVGFASITNDGYLDFMFVSKDHQRKGIAHLLYTQLEKAAIENNIHCILSDVSITAKPFFQSQGFVVVQQQEAVIDGTALTNFKMQKQLG